MPKGQAPVKPNATKKNNKGSTGGTPQAAKRCKQCGYSLCHCGVQA